MFSNNHEVFTAGGTVVGLGSFRAAAGFVANFRAQRRSLDQPVRETWNYLDFYMGTLGTPGEDDLSRPGGWPPA